MRARRIVILWMLAGVCSVGQVEARRSGGQDYSGLTLDTLPPPGLMIKRVREAQPYSESRLNEMERRHRLSALIPRLSTAVNWNEQHMDVIERLTLNDEWITRGGGARVTSTQERDKERIQPLNNSGFVETRAIEFDRRIDNYPQYRSSQSETFATVGRENKWAMNWHVLLTWDLTQLVFHSDEPQIVRARGRKAQYERILVKKTSARYTQLRTALINRERQPGHPRWEDTVFRLATWLDAMSDHFLSDYVATMKLDAEIDQARDRNRLLREERERVPETQRDEQQSHARVEQRIIEAATEAQGGEQQAHVYVEQRVIDINAIVPRY